MMNLLKYTLTGCLALLAPLASAHEGHGVPGSFAHDLQHQAWLFAAMVLVSSLLLASDKVLALARERFRKRDRSKR